MCSLQLLEIVEIVLEELLRRWRVEFRDRFLDSVFLRWCKRSRSLSSGALGTSGGVMAGLYRRRGGKRSGYRAREAQRERRPAVGGVARGDPTGDRRRVGPGVGELRRRYRGADVLHPVARIDVGLTVAA